MSAPPAEVKHREGAGDRALDAIEILGFAILASALVVALMGHDPLRTVAAVVHGAFGSGAAIHATLAETVPLVFAGLAVALPLRLGLFNIGAEGQLVLGGLAAGLVAASATSPAGAIVGALAAAVAVGLCWGAIAGALRAWLGVHEVLSTILLNLIAIPLASLIVKQSWAKAAGQINQTEPATGTVPEVYAFLVLAVLLALAWDVWLGRSRGGLEARAIGSSARAAEGVGIRTKPALFAVLALAGGLAGLTGAQQVLDQHHRYVDGFSPGFGFTAIAVALLGRSSGLGVVLAALALGGLRSGAFSMDALGVAPREVATIVQGVVILVAAALTARDLGQAR